MCSLIPFSQCAREILPIRLNWLAAAAVTQSAIPPHQTFSYGGHVEVKKKVWLYVPMPLFGLGKGFDVHSPQKERASMIPTSAHGAKRRSICLRGVGCIGDGRSGRDETKGQLTPTLGKIPYVFLNASALLHVLRYTDACA